MFNRNPESDYLIITKLRFHERKCKGFAVLPKKIDGKVHETCNRCGTILISHSLRKTPKLDLRKPNTFW